jgi:hypothetical protein
LLADDGAELSLPKLPGSGAPVPHATTMTDAPTSAAIEVTVRFMSKLLLRGPR